MFFPTFAARSLKSIVNDPRRSVQNSSRLIFFDKEQTMRVSIFGLGYVGAVSCSCLAQDEHDVIGVDINEDKVRLINDGKTPIIEDEIGDIIARTVASGKLRATTNIEEAINNTDISLVAVGTPSRSNGSLDIEAVVRVSELIGLQLKNKAKRHIVTIRSTVLPGTVRKLVLPILETSSGKRAGEGFGLCFNPEFLREGSSVRDHYDPPFWLVGSDVEEDARQVAKLYEKTKAKVFYSSIETAEMVKYVCNAFHALKLTFANEIGILAKSLNVDSHRVMELVCEDRKQNISPAYLRPGFAFGGSCLPKDVRALLAYARSSDNEVPLLRSIMDSNESQIKRAVDIIMKTKKRKMSMLGISFKAGTDDLRESPLVGITEALIGKGIDVKIHDENVQVARLVGANKRYIINEIPHISSLLTKELFEVVDHGEVLIVGNDCPTYRNLLPRMITPGKTIIDLAYIKTLAEIKGVEYIGITWP
jgi:GDP-mannose 6-dehydrogenase